MNEGLRPTNRITAPIKHATQKFAYMGLILTAVGMIILGKVDILLMEQVRVLTTDVVAPIMKVVSRPASYINTYLQDISEIVDIRTENSRLRKENARLLQWQEIARKLDSENAILKQTTHFVATAPARFITARVIGDTGGAFAHSLLLSAGYRDNVRKGQAAASGSGLMGRVADVGARSSRLLLITDLNSRIPVLIESSRIRGILAGNNTDMPLLIHLLPGSVVSQGDRILTSGHGGVFPKGIPIGVVASVSDNGIAIQPFVDPNRIEVARILDFGLDGIIKPPVTGQNSNSAN